MKKFVLFLMFLMVAACTHNHHQFKTTVPKPEVCGYPKGCYCQPVNDHTGLLVSRDGRANLGPVMCIPDEEDLSRRDSFCLPIVGKSWGIKIVDGRVQVEKPGHTHDVQASDPVRCSAAPQGV